MNKLRLSFMHTSKYFDQKSIRETGKKQWKQMIDIYRGKPQFSTNEQMEANQFNIQ